MDIADFDRWLHKTASGMTGPDGHDDLVQEGRIALWKAIERADLEHPGLAGYLTKAAKGRMQDMLTGKGNPTGHIPSDQRSAQSPRGVEARAKIRAFLAEHPEASNMDIVRGTGMSQAAVSVQRRQLDIDTEIEEPGSIEALRDAGYDAADALDPVLDMIVQAYFYGQIAQALDVLTPSERRYVHLRFWEGYEKRELVAAFGYDPSAIWPSARERLRPVLEDLLNAA